MKTRQLSDLRADVAWLADIPTPSTTTRHTTADVNTQINKGYYEMFLLALQAGGDSAYRKSATITTTANTSLYALPADFFELKSAEILLNTTDRVLLERFTQAERPYLASATPGWGGEPFKYAVQGKTADVNGADSGAIEFLPIPSAVLSVQIFYVYAPNTMSADLDTVDGFAGFEDYAVLYAAKRIATRDENFDLAMSLAPESERVKQNILTHLNQRDAMGPPRVQMTRQPWRPRYSRGR